VPIDSPVSADDVVVVVNRVLVGTSNLYQAEFEYFDRTLKILAVISNVRLVWRRIELNRPVLGFGYPNGEFVHFVLPFDTFISVI